MDRIKKTSAMVAIIGIVLFSAIMSFTGIASAEQITPEELFENLSGGWAFNGTMTVGEEIATTNGTRTVIRTGPSSAEFVVITQKDEEEEVETGEAWWDAVKAKLAIKEGDVEPTYRNLTANGYGGTYELEGGIPELNITETVFCNESETFVDANTTVKTWVASNATGAVLAKWVGTFTRTEVWHVVENISIQDAVDNAADGDTVIVHEGIYEEQLYIAKSLDLKAAEGENPEIRAPATDTLESYVFDFIGMQPVLVTPVIMVNGSADDVSLNITGFVVNGSSATLETSEYGINGIAYINADGMVKSNEIKNIWGLQVEDIEPLRLNGHSVLVVSHSSNNVSLYGNNIHNFTGVNSQGIMILGSGVTALISENTVTGARSPESSDQNGIAVAMGATAKVMDNTVTDIVYFEGQYYPCSIVFNDAGGTLSGNTITGAGIWTNAGWFTTSPLTVSIHENIVDVSELSGLSEVTPSGIAVSTHGWAYAGGEEPSITATIEGNHLTGVSGSGIVIGDDVPEHKPIGTVTATITRNIVTDYVCGIKLLNTSNSTVYLNDFVNNTQNVLVNESTNIYSSPEKLYYTYEGRDYTNYVGNYWSDYEGADADADGIGDIPREITGDNPDNYPLMGSNKDYEQIGILVMAHGSPSDSWCAPVRSAVQNVSSQYPVELGFLEFVPNETINVAVDKLDEACVTKIIAVPLFISSSSGHIAELEYVLGLRADLSEMSTMSTTQQEPVTNVISTMRTSVEGVEMERSVISREGRLFVSYTPISEGISITQHGGGAEEEEELVPVDTTAEIVLTNAIDDHWTIADILVDRTVALSNDPANETVVFFAHGTDDESDFAGWVNSSESLAEQVKLKLKHGLGLDIEDVRYSFVFPNETLHSDLLVKAVVENVSATSYPIVIPLMVSEGYFTGRKIPKLLENLSYAYPKKGERALTPHPDVAEWIELTAAKELSYPPVLIYDGEELLAITIEDAGRYHGEGVIEICPCVACAFRSTLRAFSDEELWGGVPHRGDLKIISAHPSDGHQMTFEYILGSSEDLVIKEGVDTVNITADNYDYTFIRKSTSDSVELKVNETLFPERFFELRTKKKLGTATPEETKTFKMLKGELKEKFMYLPMTRVFDEVSGTSFGTGEGTYPSISGVHEGTITPSHEVVANKMFTYHCKGTGGHSTYVWIYNDSETLVEAHWGGYTDGYQNISFNSNITLEAGKTYNYTIHTGSYPQIHHTDRLETNDGVIECTEFVDTNGKSYSDWIPAIKLLS